MAAKADLSNWRDSPYNKWSFINADKVVRTDVIKKSDRVSEWESQPRQFEDFRIAFKGESLDLQAFISQSHTDGLIVLQHGKLLYEGYFGQNDKASKHIIMSMTKSVTGLVVGILQEQGKLNVDDLVTKYVPEVAKTIYKDVTIRQCIDMRSGAKYADASHEYRCAVGWNPEDGTEKHTDFHDFVANFHPERAVDDRFEYVSVNTDLMGWVIERAAGKKFAQVVQEVLWQPMGAESDALMTVDKAGNARAAGGLCASLRDIARVGYLFVENSKGVVPPAWLDDIVHGGDREAFAKGSWASAFEGDFRDAAYRSYWLADGASETVIAIGIFGQMLFVDRKNGIVVAKTASQIEAIDFGLVKMTALAFKEFQRVLTG